RRGTTRARDRDRTFLERLAERVERLRLIFGELVEEQGARVRERHLARARRRASSDECEVRRGVMRRAERSRDEQRPLGIDEPGNAVGRARLDGLVGIERREDRWQRAREQRLARARWSDEEEVVRTGGGDLERALR